MKRILKIAAVALALLFIGIQFIRPDHTNLPVVPGESMESSIAIPPEVASVISRSCSDCHTNSTTYPWYSQVAPVSWVLADHVSDGRRHLNLSVWNTYEAKKKAKKLEEVCEQVEMGEMPLPSYLWIHRDAVLTDGEKKLLCDWATAEKNKVAM